MHDELRELWWRLVFAMSRRRSTVLWGGRPGWDTQVGSWTDSLQQAMLNDSRALLRLLREVKGF